MSATLSIYGYVTKTVVEKTRKERNGARGQYYWMNTAFGRQQVWRPYSEPVVQRYGEEREVTKLVSARYNFTNENSSGMDLKEAFLYALRHPPKPEEPFVTVDAYYFLTHKDEYAQTEESYWKEAKDYQGDGR